MGEIPSAGEIAGMNSDNRDLRDRFAATVSAYRTRGVQVGFVLVALLLIFWYLVLFVPGATLLAVLTFLVLFTAMLFAKRSMPRLICPACECDTDEGAVRFCPECGSGELQKKGEDKYFLAWPRCRACGRELSRGRRGRRFYRIRFCTRCGAYLHERGV
jgi:hypothetical protein